MLVHRDLLDRQARGLRSFRLHPRHDLRAGPDLAGVRLEMNGAVHWLHGRVRQERQLIGLFVFLASREPLGDVADRFGDDAILLAGGAYILPDVVRGKMRVRAAVPFDLERVEPFLRRPHMVAYHANDIVEHDDLLHAGNFLGGTVVDLVDLAAEYRTCRYGRKLHAGQHRVDAIDDLAVGLAGRVETLQRLADQHKVLRIFDRNLFGRRLVARRLRQIAIGNLASAGGMQDLAIRCAAAGGLDLPLLRGGLNQHRARGCASDAERLPEGAHRGGATR